MEKIKATCSSLGGGETSTLPMGCLCVPSAAVPHAGLNMTSTGLPLICLSEGTFSGDNSILGANNVRTDTVIAGHASTLPGANLFMRLQLRNLFSAGDPSRAGHAPWWLKHDGKGHILQRQSPAFHIRICSSPSAFPNCHFTCPPPDFECMHQKVSAGKEFT